MRCSTLLGLAFAALTGLMAVAVPAVAAPATAEPPVAEPVTTDLFVAGQEGYACFRIPAILAASGDTVLAFAEGRKAGCGDSGDIDLVMRRSSDGGQTWGPITIVWDDGDNTCGNPCPVYDRSTNTVLLLMTHNRGVDVEREIIAQTSEGTRTVWLAQSTDDGAKWSRPVEITATAKRPGWTWYATGPGVGIQLEQGPRRGRLVIPCDHIEAESKKYFSHVIYSDDHGLSWQLGGRTAEGVNECQVVELADGRLMLNMRNYNTQHQCRAVATSNDGGQSWSPLRWDAALVEPVCQASLLRFAWQSQSPAAMGRTAGKALLFSNPAHTKADGGRRDMTVRLSYDEGQTWPVSRLLHAGPAAYSCLVVTPDGQPGCLYEAGQKGPYERIVFTRFTRQWLEGPGRRP